MCQAIAGRITRVEGEDLDCRAIVEVVGTEREVSLALLPGTSPGDWVIFHSGYALRKVAEAEVEALEALVAGECSAGPGEQVGGPGTGVGGVGS